MFLTNEKGKYLNFVLNEVFQDGTKIKIKYKSHINKTHILKVHESLGQFP